MKTIRAVGFQDNDRLRGWGRGLLSVPHASSDPAVGAKMQREVRAGITALLPAGDFVVLHAQSLGHRFFGYFAIGPRGSGGNASFCFQSLAKFLVRTAHMFGKSVSTTRFVALQIVSRNVIARAARGAFCSAGHFAARYLWQATITRCTAAANPEQ